MMYKGTVTDNSLTHHWHTDMFIPQTKTTHFQVLLHSTFLISQHIGWFSKE